MENKQYTIPIPTPTPTPTPIPESIPIPESTDENDDIAALREATRLSILATEQEWIVIQEKRNEIKQLTEVNEDHDKYLRAIKAAAEENQIERQRYEKIKAECDARLSSRRQACCSTCIYCVELVQPILLETEDYFIFGKGHHTLEKINLPKIMTKAFKKTMEGHKIKIEIMIMNIKMYPVVDILKHYENLIYRAITIRNAIQEHVLNRSFNYEETHTLVILDIGFIFGLFKDWNTKKGSGSDVNLRNAYHYHFYDSNLKGYGLPHITLPKKFKKKYMELKKVKAAVSKEIGMVTEGAMGGSEKIGENKHNKKKKKKKNNKTTVVSNENEPKRSVNKPLHTQPTKKNTRTLREMDLKRKADKTYHDLNKGNSVSTFPVNEKVVKEEDEEDGILGTPTPQPIDVGNAIINNNNGRMPYTERAYVLPVRQLDRVRDTPYDGSDITPDPTETTEQQQPQQRPTHHHITQKSIEKKEHKDLDKK